MHTSTEEYLRWGVKQARLAARFSAREYATIQQVLAHTTPTPLSVWTRGEFITVCVACEQDEVAAETGRQVRAFKDEVKKMGRTVQLLHVRLPQSYLDWLDQFRALHAPDISTGLYFRWLLHSTAPRLLAAPSSAEREAAYAALWKRIHDPANRVRTPVVTPA